MVLDKDHASGAENTMSDTIQIPPERGNISHLQAERSYEDWEAVEEAEDLGLLRPAIRQAEISPTFRCTEDCAGCPDRISLHLEDPPEDQVGEQEWYKIIDRLEQMGLEYYMLIGGTIDRHELTPKLMSYILDKEPPVDFGWFTDGIPLLDYKSGRPNDVFGRLANAGMLNATTHISVDYLVDEGKESDGAILDPRQRITLADKGGSRYYKSAFGLRLARELIKQRAKRVVINSAISAHNLDEILPIYSFVEELQKYAQKIDSPTVVLHSFCPWTWRPQLARGDDPKSYDPAMCLTQDHCNRLEEISNHMLNNTQKRIQEGEPRIAASSSGFIAGLPEYGVTQDVPFDENGSGVLAVEPSGRVRMDPVFVSARMLEVARSPYSYRDRDLDHNPFEKYNRLFSGDAFPNLMQTTRGNVVWR